MAGRLRDAQPGGQIIIAIMITAAITTHAMISMIPFIFTSSYQLTLPPEKWIEKSVTPAFRSTPVIGLMAGRLNVMPSTKKITGGNRSTSGYPDA